MQIICKNLSYSYPGTQIHVFKGINLSLKGPGFFSLFGLSGTGKSTLARLLAKGLLPETGRIYTDLERILYAYDSERLPGWLSIKDHLQKITPDKNLHLLKGLITNYGMEGLLPHRFLSLSMGQKNKANLIRYLVQDFDLLITDEVLANVDEPTRYEILESIKRLFPQKMFLYISHNAIEVARFSRTIFVLSQTQDGSKKLIKIDGLDQQREQNPSEGMVRKKVYEILNAASTGEPIV
ncbi:MAG: ATP-binding cassette domain-containing protein [Dissulfurimicrobium sp.]|uniref:ATP-binding cassette domain-containing protein n=1 Tax=Dissulfurimicrobium sp. TaxID=2022436 RepID=UPI00404AF744